MHGSKDAAKEACARRKAPGGKVNLPTNSMINLPGINLSARMKWEIAE